MNDGVLPAAFRERFEIEAVHELRESDRTLYRMRRKDGGEAP